MKGEFYPFGIVGMANKGDCLQKGETVKFQLCVLGQNGQTMAVNIAPFRRATVECVKDQVRVILSFRQDLSIYQIACIGKSQIETWF